MYLSNDEQSPKIDMKKTQLIIKSNKKVACETKDPKHKHTRQFLMPKSPFEGSFKGDCKKIFGLKMPVECPDWPEMKYDQTPKSM